ncbi:MAG: hypothetical protein HY864_18215 [Chloroflexi bacterium]|nr:hypothetical protein [Chloroflexota bacterium]
MSEHLNQKGVMLARRIGQHLGPFERVVTSTHHRAFETAIAMGFAVDEQNELVSTYGREVERNAPWPQPFANYVEIVKQDGPAAGYARKLAQYYVDMMDDVSENGSALVINHGGVVELGVIGCLPNFDFSTWGDPVGYCEGARLFWADGRFVNAEVLRVSS